MGVRPSLPVAGIDFLLGNDTAGGDVWGKSSQLPEVVAVPLSSEEDECGKRFPDVFPSCAVTRSMSEQTGAPNVFEDLQSTFLADLDSNSSKITVAKTSRSVSPAVGRNEKSHWRTQNAKIPISRAELIKSQKEDDTLTSRLASACPTVDLVLQPQGYFFRKGVLMRKWKPRNVPDDWRGVLQIVAPTAYRGEILRVAHDAAAGHLGVTKTYDSILRHFYWPGLKKDVRHFCKTCHICQMIGKPNQKIPPAPLYPIPVIKDPFEHIIIYCVGPLPRSSRGYQFRFTMMCANTRFPEAVPLRTITSKNVIQAMIKFFSFVGLPRVVQSDRGTNFTSRVFAKVLKTA